MDKETSKKMDELLDDTETVYSAEYYLLKKIWETSSDLVKAKYWKDFCEASGGMQSLADAHERAVQNFEEWIQEFE